MTGERLLFPFPLSRWSSPALTGFGRLPMAPALDPFGDVAAAQSGAPSPWVLSLDGRWEFRLVDDPDQVTLADVGTDRPSGGWSELDMPGAWALQGHGAPAYLNVRMPFEGQAPSVPAANPTGIHRRSFTVPARWRRRRLLLRVGAANSMGFVWVNGTFVGLGTDSHLASTYDISAAVRDGANTVCIVVPQWSASTWVEDQDQWWVAGLHRGVTLVSVPWVSLAGTATVPGLDADGTTGTLDLDIEVDDAGRGTIDRAGEDARHRRGERARPVVATAHPGGHHRRPGGAGVAPARPGRPRRHRRPRARAHLHLAGAPGARAAAGAGDRAVDARDAASLSRGRHAARRHGRGDRRAHPLDRLSPGRGRRPSAARERRRGRDQRGEPPRRPPRSRAGDHARRHASRPRS